MNTKALKTVMLLVFGILLLGQFQEVFPQKVPLESALAGSNPALYTEKSVYFYGETVKINGAGFVAFDPVAITVRRTDVATIAFLGEPYIAEWMVIADEKGMIETAWIVNYPGERFAIEALGGSSKVMATTEMIVMSHTANLDQCRNGTQDAPNECTGTNWVNGDLNGSQAHYIEGESVPYRLVLGNLTPGLHNVTIEFDTTEGGHHAIDYLTTYNRSELTAAPCDGIAGCDPAASTTRAIPLDPEVAKGFDGVLGTADDITQIPGDFTLFGGNLTTVSSYTVNGTYAGSSQTRITINFTTNLSTVVLSWGGHIATREDWGENNSAVAISGAPFHMRVFDVDGEGGGNQDRSMQSSAVYYPARITIIKDGQPNGSTMFPFTATGPSVFNFTLDDDGDTTNTYSNTQVFDGLTNFGAGHTVTVAEGSSPAYWALTQLTCTSNPNGGAGTNNNVISLPARQVEIFLEEGEFVSCTFVNSVITASNVMIEGRVIDANGRGIPNARLTLTRLYLGVATRARTNPFGYYRFEEIPVGEDYSLEVDAKGYLFKVPLILLTPMDNLTEVNFQAIPPE